MGQITRSISEHLIEAAREYRLNGNIEGAIEILSSNLSADALEILELADLYRQKKEYAKALNTVKRIKEPQYIEKATLLTGQIYLDEDAEKGVYFFKDFLLKFPQHIEAQFLLGEAYRKNKKYNQAIKIFEAIVPEKVSYLKNYYLGMCFLDKKLLNIALHYLLMSYSINNKFKPCLVKLLGIFDNRINGELDIHLLGEKQLTVISEIIAQPLIATRNVELYTYTIIISFLKEYPLPKDESYLVKLIHSVLRKDFVKNYDIECRFIRLRKQLLIKALDKTNHSNKSFLRLANSIAIQVRLNHFLWDISESEFQIVQNVKAAFYEVSLPLEKEFSVAIVAMYEMHLKEEFIPWVKDETLKHYFTEEQVAIKIDEVTENLLAVKQQYEFFPYPMWQGVNQIVPKSLNSWVEVMFPKQFVNFPKTNHRVLIAGTGTGRHAIQVALRHPEIQVVGIDLSIQSLRYAKKQANKLGISNIDFKQKDILALNAKEKFAMIECVGVLHHLPNPKEGLIKLQNALEFGGILKLGLYSKKAREPLIEVKKEFEVPNKTQEIEVIRKMRSEMLKKANQEYLFYAMRFTEFFNLNGFVDLFLHASEINYTFPMLKNLLSDCELSYVKFDLSNKKNLNINYRAENTFAFWEEVESKDPTFFKSMYLFWCVKD